CSPLWLLYALSVNPQLTLVCLFSYSDPAGQAAARVLARQFSDRLYFVSAADIGKSGLTERVDGVCAHGPETGASPALLSAVGPDTLFLFIAGPDHKDRPAPHESPARHGLAFVRGRPGLWELFRKVDVT
ncbi:hypothetical protein LJC59_10095, partial [Desulfovibrio sp. OttesenSCG-928-A18]|nr:hypothetical protein [Desulfovibrio sp. OttesenSCG-928-A18]